MNNIKCLYYMSENKSIDISGTNNRYLINKLKKDPPIVKMRKALKNMSLPSAAYSIENQLSIINDIYHNRNEYKDVLNQIETIVKEKPMPKPKVIKEKTKQVKEIIEGEEPQQELRRSTRVRKAKDILDL